MQNEILTVHIHIFMTRFGSLEDTAFCPVVTHTGDI